MSVDARQSVGRLPSVDCARTTMDRSSVGIWRPTIDRQSVDSDWIDDARSTATKDWSPVGRLSTDTTRLPGHDISKVFPDENYNRILRVATFEFVTCSTQNSFVNIRMWQTVAHARATVDWQSVDSPPTVHEIARCSADPRSTLGGVDRPSSSVDARLAEHRSTLHRRSAEVRPSSYRYKLRDP